MTIVSELTAHPRLFRRCYWGAFEDSENPHITEQIITNHNALANEFKIGFHMPSLKGMLSGLLRGNIWDHVECYGLESPGEVLLVTSPYCPQDTFEKLRDLASRDGLCPWNPIYSTKAATFFRVFCCLDEILEFAEEHASPGEFQNYKEMMLKEAFHDNWNHRENV